MAVRKTAVAALMLSVSAQAHEAVPWGYRQVAEDHGIPAEVLYAVALTESEKKLTGGLVRPWPWTLNVRGRPERYATRKEAHAALTRYLRQGITLIDVGLMQVNWHWHNQRLGSPWEALEPYHNMRVGSRILREGYTRTRDWKAAVGKYHAPNDARRAQRYRRLVEKRMVRIQGKGFEGSR